MKRRTFIKLVGAASALPLVPSTAEMHTASPLTLAEAKRIQDSLMPPPRRCAIRRYSLQQAELATGLDPGGLRLVHRDVEENACKDSA